MERKLQSAVDVMLQSIDANKMRPMQKKTYLAMAACFDSKNATSQQIEACVGNSSHAVKVSQQIIQGEMNQFQGRLQRCGADCQDSVRDQNPNMDDQSKVDRAQGQMNSCMSSCVGEKSIYQDTEDSSRYLLTARIMSRLFDNISYCLSTEMIF